MTKQDLTKVGIIAMITILTVTLPGLLIMRGLPIPWGLALLAGYLAVAGLAYWLGRRLL
jgi:hypothetical protein